MAGFNVSALADHIKNSQREMLSAMVAEADTIKSGKVAIMDKIKYKQRIPFFSKNLVWQSGNCVGDDSTSGSTVFTEKELEVAQITHYDKSCIDDFNTKWMGDFLPKGSTYSDADYPQEIADNMVELTAEDIEIAIWIGGYANTSEGLNGQVDGWMKSLVNTAYSASTFGATSSVSSWTTSNAAGYVSELYQNAPASIASKALNLFLSRKNYNILKEALLTAFPNYTEVNRVEGVESFTHPIYTNMEIYPTHGLDGINAVVLTNDGNLVVGTDSLDDMEVTLGYIEHEDKVFERIKMKLGTEVKFETQVGVITW